MADETPPLDDMRLEQMRGYAEAIRTAKHAIESVSSELVHASDYILTLIAEVDRLRAREAVAMAIVRYVATMPNAQHHMSLSDWAVCPFGCGAEASGYWNKPILSHTPDCPVTKACALLAQE